MVVGTVEEGTQEELTNLILGDGAAEDDGTTGGDDKPEAAPDEIDPSDEEDVSEDESDDGDPGEEEPVYSVMVGEEEVQVTHTDLVKNYQERDSYIKDTKKVEKQKQDMASKLADIEKETQSVREERAMYANELSAVVTSLKAEVDEGAKIDFNALADEDPAEATRQFMVFQQKKESLAKAEQSRQQILEKEQADMTKARDAFMQEQARKIISVRPDLADPAKARETQDKVDAYLQTVGFNDQEVRGLVDGRLWLMVDKARRWDVLQAKKPGVRDRVKKLGKNVKPRAPKSRSEADQDALTVSRNKLKSSGSVEDFAELLKQR